uniref:FAD dependent oxidoreductase domain-containing protein n=1 Tax=Oryza nivara TaxID=4536 RepID=A0A0E0HLS0_ORYNI
MPPPPSSLPPRVLPNLVSCSRRAVTSAATAAAAAYSTAVAAGGGGGGGRPLRYAVLGAGFAGLSVAWHLLKHSPKGSRVRVDIYDESGIGGGASGVSGGLLHPFYGRVLNSGKSVWICCVARSKRMEPLGQMELAKMRPLSGEGNSLGIIRPPTSEKTADILLESSLQSCSLQVLDSDEAQCLIPGLCVPLNFAVYMPLALNINPKKYLQVALFFACQNMSDEASLSSSEQKECKLYNEHVDDLQQLAGDYDSVIICLGARASSLPELTNKLPLRTCRGVIAEFQLPSDTIETYGSQSPSILSDAWLAFQGPRTVSIGSTWQWKSENYSSSVSDDEALNAMEELLPKASAVYPGITKWKFVQARAGIRAMPPLTANGSLPLLGCLNDVIGKRSNCSFWLVGGLGARGLLFHGLAGKLTAKAVISCDENLIPPEFTCWKEP